MTGRILNQSTTVTKGDSVMEVKILLTSLVFIFVFIGAIKFHGEDRPSELVMGIEGGGVVLSAFMFIASLIAIIWAY